MVFLERILAGKQLKKMRIISGDFKNKKLNFPKNFKTRPLKDRVRENIFNIIEHSSKVDVKIENSQVLDLYAGIGSFGLECVSRRAKKIAFVENNKEALTNLKKNIISLKVEQQVRIYSLNLINFFRDFKSLDKFDIVFLDPPYKNNDFHNFFKSLKQNFLSKKHIVLIHREKNSDKEAIKKFNIVENKIYGRSEIFFLKLF